MRRSTQSREHSPYRIAPYKRWSVTFAALALSVGLSAAPALATPDTGIPVATIVSPDFGQTVDESTFTIAGVAIDDIEVASIEAVVVRIRPGRRALFLQQDGSFNTTVGVVGVDVDQPAQESTWTLSIEGLIDGNYRIYARAIDSAGNTSNGFNTSRSFRVVDNPEVPDPPAPPVDQENPIATLTTPSGAPGANPGPAVTFAGLALDDVAVDSVRVMVRRIAFPSGLPADYLQADGSFSSEYSRVAASVAVPGTERTEWTLTVDLADGAYTVQEVAVLDRSGKEEFFAYNRFFEVGA